MSQSSVTVQSYGVESSIAQLSSNSTSEEFSVWKFRLKNLLEEHDCYEAVLKESCSYSDVRNAKNLILPAISDLESIVKEESSAKVIWEALVNKFEKADSNNRGYDGFMEAKNDEEKLKQAEKLENDSYSVAGAQNIASNKLLMKKMTQDLETSTYKRLHDKITTCMRNIISKLGDSGALVICEMAGRTLISLARRGAGLVSVCLAILGSLCLVTAALPLLEEMGVVDLFASLVSGTVATAEWCIKGLSNFANHNIAYFSKKLQGIPGATRDVGNACVAVVRSGSNSVVVHSLRLLKILAEKSYLVRSLIEEKLSIFFDFISTKFNRLSEKVLSSALYIMHSIDESRLISYVKTNFRSLEQANLNGMVERFTPYASHGMRILLDQFQNVVVDTLHRARNVVVDTLHRVRNVVVDTFRTLMVTVPERTMALVERNPIRTFFGFFGAVSAGLWSFFR